MSTENILMLLFMRDIIYGKYYVLKIKKCATSFIQRSAK